MRPEARRGGIAAAPTVFATTHWSVVLAAQEIGSPPAAQALDRLCHDYWYPLYVYVRRQGRPHEEAEDLTQAFFAHVMQKDFLRNVGREKGRFRSFLLASLKHFLVDQWEKSRTVKRGGDHPGRPLDLRGAEARYLHEPGCHVDPQTLYERRWALELLEHVFNRLHAEAVAAGREVLFDQLSGCLLGERQPETYTQLGAKLGLSETAVKVTVHRLRRRYRELLREEIAHTLANGDELEAELRYLFEVVSR